MKLGSLKEGGRDGTLVLVSNDLKRIIPIEAIAPTFQKAIENWAIVEPQLMIFLLNWMTVTYLNAGLMIQK